MKTMLMVAAALVMTAGGSGCNCWNWCRRPATPCAPACGPACAPACATGDPYLTAPTITGQPATVISPAPATTIGPEAYTPAQ